MEEVERRTILRALQAFGGNVTDTAKALGIGRATLSRYIRKHNLGSSAEKEPEPPAEAPEPQAE